MDTLRQDVAFALRALAKSPGFSAIAIACIALGIGANVFVWSPINAILLRPLPYHESERVMQLSGYVTTEQRGTYGSWSFPDYVDASTELRDVFASVAVHTTRSFNVGGGAEPERLRGARVSPSLFPLLGVRPALGRFFRPDEDGDARVAVIGYGVWERKFGRAPDIIGRTIPIDGAPYEVIGVMARGMRIPEREDLWLPLHPGEARAHRDWRFYQVSARLAPGVSVEQADARLSTFMRGLEQRHGDTNRSQSAWVVPMNDLIAREVRPVFLTMLGAVGFVLLIACANVANLLLARGSARQREVAVRLAMGASRLRIVRQFLTESFLLAVAGGTLGLLLGTWTIELFMTRMIPTTVPYWMTFDVDRTIVLITIGTTLVTGLVFGAVPALQLSRPSLTETLKDGGTRGASAGTATGRTRHALVVTELAMSMVLLVGAGLMVRSFLATQDAPLGYGTRDVLGFELALAGDRYGSDTARAAFSQRLAERLTAIPGVRRVGMTTQLPVASCCRTDVYFPEGKTYPQSSGPYAWYTAADPGFLPAMQIPLLDGRGFEPNDALPTAAAVVIVDSVLAAREWPGERAVGKRVRLGTERSPLATVVGVIPHVIMRDVAEITQPQAVVPMPAGTGGTRWYAVHVNGDPAALIPAVRAAVRTLDPDLPLAQVASMEAVVKDRMFQPRVYGTMFALFAAIALLLAMIGLYGVMSYLVAQRTSELGIRMALGATARDVTRLVLGGAVRLLVVGLGLGIPAALGLAQLLRGVLYGVSATDPLTMLGIPLFLSLVALLASAIPARRAARVDPAIALRRE